MKKQIIEGLEIYQLSNEFQIYDENGFRQKIWRSGNKEMDRQRLLKAIQQLISQ